MKFRVLDKVQKALLSVSKLTQAGFEVEFNSEGGYISRGQKSVWFGRVGGMFRLKGLPSTGRSAG